MSTHIQSRIPPQFIPLSPPKRFLKICHQKLPNGFFGDELTKQNSYRLGTSNLMTKPQCLSSQMVSRSNSKNRMPEENRLQNYSKSIQKRNFNRETYTARQKNSQNYQMNLIMSIINTTKQMKRALRKRSVQLKKQIQTSQKKDELYFELPPIFLRKGVTTPF